MNPEFICRGKQAEASQAGHQPLVSIVIPAHNEEESIATCLESVLKDSYPHNEIIVVDDASTDNTSDILKHFKMRALRQKNSESCD